MFKFTNIFSERGAHIKCGEADSRCKLQPANLDYRSSLCGMHCSSCSSCH
uniref:Uncharacterized protein n=1 Tax=Setaria italica TaxID=4555 RepID=K4ANF4_SETIT